MSASYRPHYHVSVPFGWANDPNGTVYYRGKAHLFYQHYPHRPEWGPMHWNHVTTEDFIHWEQRPVALWPDQPYELVCGCCSGSAVEKDGRLYLMYTAAQPMMQRQCLAVSEDGDRFVKCADNPILTAEMLSPEIYEEDFRDPRIFRHGDAFYLIAGVRYLEGGRRAEPAPTRQREITNPRQPDPSHKKEGWGNLCLLKSDDLFRWKYVGHLLYPQPGFSEDFYRLDGVYECPDYFVTDTGAEVLLSSPQNLPRSGNLYQNIHSGLYMLGHLDFETGRFQVQTIGEVDSGFDFYAAQTLRTPDGRTVMIAWKEMWDRSFPSAKEEEWAGTYTLPRELTVEGDRLIQKPVREIEAFRAYKISYQNVMISQETNLQGVSGRFLDMTVRVRPGNRNNMYRYFKINVAVDGERATLIRHKPENSTLRVDRSRSGFPHDIVNSRDFPVTAGDELKLRIIMDRYSLELFVNDGEQAASFVLYTPVTADSISFSCDGTAVIDVEKYELIV